MIAPSRVGVARTLDAPQGCTHTLASVEPPSYNQKVGEPGRLRIVSILQILTHPYHGYKEVLPSIFGTEDLGRFPRIQVCCQLSHKHIQ